MEPLALGQPLLSAAHAAHALPGARRRGSISERRASISSLVTVLSCGTEGTEGDESGSQTNPSPSLASSPAVASRARRDSVQSNVSVSDTLQEGEELVSAVLQGVISRALLGIRFSVRKRDGTRDFASLMVAGSDGAAFEAGVRANDDWQGCRVCADARGRGRG